MTSEIGPAITILAADTKLVEPVAAGWQLILAAAAGIALIVVLITVAKLHPFLALIFGAEPGGCPRLVRQGIRRHGGERRHSDRPRCDVRQTARRFRRRRRDRRHDHRTRIAAGTAVGNGVGRCHYRAADVLRDRPRAVDAGHLPGRQAVAALVDHRRNPRAGRAFRHAWSGAAAPRAR